MPGFSANLLWGSVIVGAKAAKAGEARKLCSLSYTASKALIRRARPSSPAQACSRYAARSGAGIWRALLKINSSWGGTADMEMLPGSTGTRVRPISMRNSASLHPKS